MIYHPRHHPRLLKKSSCFTFLRIESEYIYSIINPPANRARRRIKWISHHQQSADSIPSHFPVSVRTRTRHLIPRKQRPPRSFNPSGTVPHWNDLMVHRSDQYPRWSKPSTVSVSVAVLLGPPDHLLIIKGLLAPARSDLWLLRAKYVLVNGVRRSSSL